LRDDQEDDRVGEAAADDSDEGDGQEGAPASAADALEKYLFQAERFILAAYSRAMPG
jgi:hypothetical protein